MFHYGSSIFNTRPSLCNVLVIFSFKRLMSVIISNLHDKRQCMRRTLWPLNTEKLQFWGYFAVWERVCKYLYVCPANIRQYTNRIIPLYVTSTGFTRRNSPTLYSFFFFPYFRNRLFPRGQLQLQTGFLNDNPEIQTVVDTHLTFIAVIPLTVWGVTICSLFRSINRFHRNHKITITLNSM